MFYEFKEMNDWEGETWSFYIPEKGNKRAMKLLKEAVEKEDNYSVREELLKTTEVKTLVKLEDDECGYMDRHTILKGKVNKDEVAEAIQQDKNADSHAVFELLYKGGIRDVMIKGD